MGILFWRHVSRSGVSYSWPDCRPGNGSSTATRIWCLPTSQPGVCSSCCRARRAALADARDARSVERRPKGSRRSASAAKYGVTSEVTLDATVNPDFSQVESDAFQVQVNQRFPIFFSEKRPFFMEGLGLFNMAGSGGDSNMRSAVHTRRIVDPRGEPK